MSNNWQNTKRKRSHFTPESEFPSVCTVFFIAYCMYYMLMIHLCAILHYITQGGTGYAGCGVELKATKAGAAMMV